MSIRRVPLSEMVTAVVSRVTAQVSPTKVLNFVPQGTPKPYVVVESISSVEANLKDSGYQEVTFSFVVISMDPSQSELNLLLNGVLGACTRTFLTLTNDFSCERVKQDGPIEVRKNYDGIEVFWTGSMRITWTVRDLQDGG